MRKRGNDYPLLTTHMNIYEVLLFLQISTFFGYSLRRS